MGSYFSNFVYISFAFIKIGIISSIDHPALDISASANENPTSVNH